jgi:hypothetical protein
MSDRRARIADDLAAKIHQLLAGAGPEMQGAAIADLTAIWLAGHHGTTLTWTTALRRGLWEAHCRYVWELVEHYDARRK